MGGIRWLFVDREPNSAVGNANASETINRSGSGNISRSVRKRICEVDTVAGRHIKMQAWNSLPRREESVVARHSFVL